LFNAVAAIDLSRPRGKHYFELLSADDGSKWKIFQKILLPRVAGIVHPHRRIRLRLFLHQIQ
jgi:hypothetical protein